MPACGRRAKLRREAIVNATLPSATVEALLGPLNAVERRNSPPQLWFAGDRSLLRQRRVAVVGTRKASEEGLRRAARLGRELAKQGVVVVSGLALGIDTAAHMAAIENGGRTIAVLGNGIDVRYPKRNSALQDAIAKDHLLLSQFEPGTPAIDRSFPSRNRTMALVSQATVIVEAQERSGTVSQGWEAIRLGRPLFLLRSLVKSGLAWPTLVLEYGAEILDDTEQLVAELPYLPESELAAAAF